MRYLKSKHQYHIRLPRPAVLLSAFLAAVLSSYLPLLSTRWHIPLFWVWLIAALVAIEVVYLAEKLIRRLWTGGGGRSS